MSRVVLLAIFLVTSSGCQHVRSFLHMDSNNSAPFLGLELSVDGSDAQKKIGFDHEAMPFSLASVVISEFEKEREARASLTENAPKDQKQDEFVSTSETQARNGNLKYSLPTVSLDDGGVDAQQVDEIISRFPGS